jgi:altronate hydrolase
LARQQVLQLHPDDNVAVALLDLPAGAAVSSMGRVVVLTSAVPAKHKYALHDILAGGGVTMYGVKVGKAMHPIQAGEILTTRNVHHEAAPFHEKTGTYNWSAPDVSRWKSRTFAGYHRKDGQVGTRNYWLVVPLVFCENRNIGVLKQAFEQELGFAAPPLYRRQVADLVRL